MADHIPPDMRRNGRPIIQNFHENELLYIRFEEVERTGMIPVDAIRSVDQSVNRGRFSQPEWVLIKEDGILLNWGYGSFLVRDIPCHVICDNGGQCWFSPSHDPLDWNYSHSQISAHKGGKDGPRAHSIKNRDLKAKYRLELRNRITVLKMPEPDMKVH